jgi:hypothetical protein
MLSFTQIHLTAGKLPLLSGNFTRVRANFPTLRIAHLQHCYKLTKTSSPCLAVLASPKDLQAAATGALSILAAALHFRQGYGIGSRTWKRSKKTF